VKVNQHLGGMCLFHIQSRRICVIRDQQEACSSYLLFGLFFDHEIAATYPSKRWVEFRSLHGVLSQMIELFITTGVRTSNRAMLNTHQSFHQYLSIARTTILPQLSTAHCVKRKTGSLNPYVETNKS
jgi:hypothetical protein